MDLDWNRYLDHLDGLGWIQMTIDGPILGRVGITLSSTVTFFNVARTLLTLTFSRAWGEIKEEYGVGSPKEISQNQPHPGVAPPETDEEVSTLFILPMITLWLLLILWLLWSWWWWKLQVVHHKYYQWVVFVLFLQVSDTHIVVIMSIMIMLMITKISFWSDDHLLIKNHYHVPPS